MVVIQVLNEDVIYSILTTLYNTTLNSELSLRFRIVVTKKLLEHFIASSSSALRFMSKFNLSCMHKILSRSELEQLVLDTFEVDMLGRCLRRVDNFFGGYECLLLTLSKLAHFPKNWTLFVDAGIVHTLISLALTETGCTKVYTIRTLLNMIPEPVITDSDHSQKVSARKYGEPLTNQVTRIIQESLTFMEFVRTFNSAGVCRDLCLGIQLLTSPIENPGL